VKVLDRPLLADENIHPQVIDELKRRGLAIRAVSDEGLAQHADTEIPTGRSVPSE
jgi:hypothetical protein